jgi:restriction endonuclease S subunit
MQIKREITGATVTGLTKDVVNDLKIPLPPLEKQNQIAEHIGQIRERAKQLQLILVFML